MNLIYLETLFLLFLIYSFAGWLIETVGDFIKHKKFINRGFLLGPYCPIYGTGVVLITLFLSKYSDDIFALFFLATMLCGILEYFTSYIMEKIFKARWWDYSKMRFNINGRICLETLVLFGLAGIIILHYLNPFFISFITKIPDTTIHIASSILFFLFITDCIISFKIINSVKSIKVSISSQIKDNTDEISSKVREIIMKKSAPYRRLLFAFPQAFADKLKEGKEKLEKTAEKVKFRVTDNIQNIKEKVSDNIQIIKEKNTETDKNYNKEKFLKKFKTNTKLSLMKFNKK